MYPFRAGEGWLCESGRLSFSSSSDNGYILDAASVAVEEGDPSTNILQDESVLSAIHKGLRETGLLAEHGLWRQYTGGSGGESHDACGLVRQTEGVIAAELQQSGLPLTAADLYAANEQARLLPCPMPGGCKMDCAGAIVGCAEGHEG